MIFGPLVVAAIFGLLVSAAIYFVWYWPDVEPDDAALEPGPDDR